MNKRIIILTVCVIALIGMNIWKWLPHEESSSEAQLTQNDVVLAQDLKIKLDLDEISNADGDTRDIFHPKVKIAPMPKKTAIKQPQVQVHIAEKSPEELAVDAAQIELTEYKCVGIAIHQGIVQAFLVRGDQNLVVTQGDRVSDRFVVSSINSEQVELIDKTTGVNGIIKMTGK